MLHPIDLTHDGVRLEGQLALPDTPGLRSGVLVMANAFGLGEQTRKQAELLAAQGYVAIATDMYGGGVRATDPKQTGALIKPLFDNPDLLRARVLAWFDTLASRTETDPDKLAALGYCFGGQCVLDLARSGADVKAVVSFHGLLETTLPAKPGGVSGTVAVYTGALDPYVPRAHIDALQDEMIAAGATWHLTVFGDACHAFTDPDADATGMPGLSYNPLAERISWAGTMALLEKVVPL
jgi:dienelactone hydrolase